MGKLTSIEDKRKDYVKDIITDYEALSERCDEVNTEKKGRDTQNTILALKTTIRANEGMSGLSANQVGINKRIICLNFNGTIKTFINPIITDTKDLVLSRETCHSEPGRTFIIARHNKIKILYMTPLNKVESVELLGMAARVFQHHMNHLDGLLLSDIGLEIFDDFDQASDEEKQEVVNMYLESLDMKSKEIDKAIKDDKEAQQIIQAIRFDESVRKGETIIEEIPLTEEEIKVLKEKQELENDKKK